MQPVRSLFVAGRQWLTLRVGTLANPSTATNKPRREARFRVIRYNGWCGAHPCAPHWIRTKLVYDTDMIITF